MNQNATKLNYQEAIKSVATVAVDNHIFENMSGGRSEAPSFEGINIVAEIYGVPPEQVHADLKTAADQAMEALKANPRV